MNINELYCRLESLLMSIFDFIIKAKYPYTVFDKNKNLYVWGKKYKANIKTSIKSDPGFSSKDGWVLQDIKEGVRFYYKK